MTSPPSNGVFLIPDILCNAGGVTVSNFEWVLAQSQLHDVNMRTGAYLNAVQRVADATALRGLYP